MGTLYIIFKILFLPALFYFIIVSRYRDESKHFKNFYKYSTQKYDMIPSYRGYLLADNMNIHQTRIIKVIAFDNKIVIMKRRVTGSVLRFEIKKEDIIAIDYKRIYKDGLHLEILHRSDKIASPYKIEFRRDIDDELIEILERLEG